MIEDACEAIGAEFQARRVGSFGDLAVFGFYPNKQLTTGEGGAVLARDPRHAARLRSLRNQDAGRVRLARPRRVGLQLPPLRTGLRAGPRAVEPHRARCSRCAAAAAERYDALLRNSRLGLFRRSRFPTARSVGSFTSSACRNRWTAISVQAALARRGIATGRYFAPIHLQPAWRSHSSAGAATLPITESIARRTLALPFFNRITVSQQEEVAAALREAIDSPS